MGNRRFKLSNIISPRFWFSRKSPKPHDVLKEQLTSKKALPVHTFDEMLLLSSSSRSFRTERIPLCAETEHNLPRLTLSQPRRNSVSNSEESQTVQRIHAKCCHGVRLKLKTKSPRLHMVHNAHRTKSGTSSSCSSSSTGNGKGRKGLSESSVTTVVKSSANAETDFKESMIEMIVGNNITDLDGLEELLVSYLMLNSDEFHEVIVTVFNDIVIGMFRNTKKCLVA